MNLSKAITVLNNYDFDLFGVYDGKETPDDVAEFHEAMDMAINLMLDKEAEILNNESEEF